MLDIFSIIQSSEWDETVKTFRDYDVYYLSGYVKAFQIHGDGEPMLFYYHDEYVRGINVVMKRDISLDKKFENLIEKNKYFDFATPYGYGGWILEGDISKSNSLFTEYEKWCDNHGIISEFVRFHPVLNNHIYSKNVYDVVPLGETVAIDTTDKETIWANFTSKNRNVIRKALNNGVKIGHGFSKDLFLSFRTIYNSTMDKDNASEYYYFEDDFYDSVLLDLSDNSTIFYAILDKTIIAISIMIFANGKLNYHLSGSLKEFQHLAPSNLLLWKAAEWGCEHGLRAFHLGGGVGSEEDSLFRFKKAFYKGDLCRYHIGKKIFNSKKYNKLLEMRSGTIKDNFFPKYRG